MPVFATFLMIISLSSIGLPGLNGFVGEFLILVGSFKSTLLGSRAFTAFAALGVIFSAVYLLWMYQRVMFGPVREGGLYNGHTLTDLTRREVAALVPIVLFVVWIGVFPETFLSKSAEAAKRTVQVIETTQRGAPIRYADSPDSSRRPLP
jgi:NADH-quinone oxidoreductase subunit M